MDNTQNVISFCTGYGGLELGIRRAGVDIRTVCNVEIETFAQANLVAKIEEGRMDQSVIYSDLKTFPASIFRGKIHGITGGYPCQPFSSAGKRKGEEDPRHLWPYIRKHVRAIRPLWCFFENVRGHTSMGLWRVLSDLEEDGYETEWGLFSAEETGAPHQRIRVFILAHNKSFGIQGLRASWEQESEAYERQELSLRESQRELGNPASLRPRGGRENCEGEQSEVLGAGLESDGELGNAKHDGLHGDSFSGGSGKDSERSEEGNWPTPRAGNPGSRKPGTGGKILAEEAKKNWGTPRGSMANSPTQKQIKLGAPAKKIEDQVMCEEQNGPPAPEKSSTSGKNHGSPKLNANWVESLQGLEVGWTQLPTEWIDSAS